MKKQFKNLKAFGKCFKKESKSHGFTFEGKLFYIEGNKISVEMGHPWDYGCTIHFFDLKIKEMLKLVGLVLKYQTNEEVYCGFHNIER